MQQKKHVLIAEDDPVSQKLLTHTLEHWGYKITSVTDGDQAWEVLSQPNPPRIVILDWVMPGLDGVSICRKIRNLPTEYYTYLLLLTANAQQEDVIHGLEAGADDYVVKPFNPVELKARLRNGERILLMQEELIDTREALRVQATRDSLTKVWNRAAILEALDRELARGKREGICIGVIMLDIDQFKQVNDTHGHQVGDIVLEEFGRRMADSVRVYDAVGRYGGDEFLIILPGCGPIDAQLLADRLHNDIASSPFKIPNGQLPISTSVGVTSSRPDKDIDSDHIISVADRAMYDVKHRGGNKVRYLPSD